MKQEIKNYIAANDLDQLVRKFGVYKTDANVRGTVHRLIGRDIDNRIYFNVDSDPDDNSVYEKKPNRFFKCTDLDVLKQFFPTYTMDDHGVITEAVPEATEETQEPISSPTPEPTTAVTKEPTVTQYAYDGTPETLDAAKYNHKFVCPDCGETRWVKPSDVFQVKYCKPCTKVHKAKKLAAKRKLRKS